MSNHRKVLIHVWRANEDDVHVHIPEASGINQTDCDVVGSATVEQVKRVGLISGELSQIKAPRVDNHDPTLTQQDDVWTCEWNVQAFCDMATSVIGYDTSMLNEADEQLQVMCNHAQFSNELHPWFSSLEVAWLDHQVRDILAVTGRCVPDPWLKRMPVEDWPTNAGHGIVDEYLKRRPDPS